MVANNGKRTSFDGWASALGKPQFQYLQRTYVASNKSHKVVVSHISNIK